MRDEGITQPSSILLPSLLLATTYRAVACRPRVVQYHVCPTAVGTHARYPRTPTAGGYLCWRYVQHQLTTVGRVGTVGRGDGAGEYRRGVDPPSALGAAHRLPITTGYLAHGGTAYHAHHGPDLVPARHGLVVVGTAQSLGPQCSITSALRAGLGWRVSSGMGSLSHVGPLVRISHSPGARQRSPGFLLPSLPDPAYATPGYMIHVQGDQP